MAESDTFHSGKHRNVWKLPGEGLSTVTSIAHEKVLLEVKDSCLNFPFHSVKQAVRDRFIYHLIILSFFSSQC